MACMNKVSGKVWLTNGDIAWWIGDRRLAYFFKNQVYQAPEGWFITEGSLGGDWKEGECRELRRIKETVNVR